MRRTEYNITDDDQPSAKAADRSAFIHWDFRWTISFGLAKWLTSHSKVDTLLRHKVVRLVADPLDATLLVVEVLIRALDILAVDGLRFALPSEHLRARDQVEDVAQGGVLRQSRENFKSF